LRGGTNWLLDILPGEYRQYGVARRYPILLARLAELQVSAEVTNVRAFLARLRVELRDVLPPNATTSAVEMLEKRLVGLAALARQVQLVTEAIERASRNPSS